MNKKNAGLLFAVTDCCDQILATIDHTSVALTYIHSYIRIKDYFGELFLYVARTIWVIFFFFVYRLFDVFIT